MVIAIDEIRQCHQLQSELSRLLSAMLSSREGSGTKKILRFHQYSGRLLESIQQASRIQEMEVGRGSSNTIGTVADQDRIF
jgi:hypothetical protein